MPSRRFPAFVLEVIKLLTQAVNAEQFPQAPEPEFSSSAAFAVSGPPAPVLGDLPGCPLEHPGLGPTAT